MEDKDKPQGWHPNMPEAEAIDLKKLQDTLQQKKLSCYVYLGSLAELSPEQLVHSGYGGKTNAEAVLDGLKRCQKEINGLIQKHVKKYPD